MGKLLRYGQGIVGLTDTDWILSAYPRSGSTWMRFMLCNLISLQEWSGRSVDFSLLDSTMVELGTSNLLEPWLHYTIPRVIKTHKRYWPFFDRVAGTIGIIRDPRDVMVSYYHFKKDRQATYTGTFDSFIRDRRFGLESWFKHYMSWLPHWTLLVKYEDMKRDTRAEFSKILSVLNLILPENIVIEAIRNSNIQNVQSIERPTQTKEARFARNGRTEQWQMYFGPKDITYYNTLVEKHNFDVYGERTFKE